MANHDVAVDGDGEDGEEWHSRQSVAQQREQMTQEATMTPGTLPEGGGGQWQVETAGHEVWYAEVDDEDGRCVANLRTLQKRML